MNNIHFKAQSGWINDPNGLCFFQGQYHLFYQYFPYDLAWGTMHWGHATTTDFINYEHHPIALFPSVEADQNGVFSGSAFIENNQMHLFYTGVKYHNFGADIHRYGDKLFESRQLKITSSDGFNFDNFCGKQVIIDKLERPFGDPIHSRDPKVWKKAGKYYLLLGSNVVQDEQPQGALLFFESDDLSNFKQICCYTQKDMGHMWECPDYFEIDKQGFIVMSPEGTMPNCEYPSHVYIAPVKFNYQSSLEVVEELKLIDIGLDCYAPQTFVDENDRRVLISWIRMPKAIEEKTIGCFTMPRVIEHHSTEICYRVHPSIEAQFKPIDIREALYVEETYKINISLSAGQTLKIGDYQIENSDGVIQFDRSTIFPIADAQLCKVHSAKYQGAVELAIYYDGYIVETFINGGTEVCTHVLYNHEPLLHVKSDAEYQISALQR
ncbi:glycoside hydrolase family 32 protein [Mollicutes bacterium LVI A0039]|nr:glycoside hydrolase family 32 protein [Mollicutes bacterium LVI A0039]